MLDDVQSQTITNNDPTINLLNNSELCTIGNCDESLLVFVEQSDSSTSSGMFTSDDSELGKISKVCANCSNKGNPVTLQLFQLNFNEAICMCIEDDCQYPLFEEDLSSYIIQQDIYEVTQSRKKRKRAKHLSKARNKKIKKSDDSELPQSEDASLIYSTFSSPTTQDSLLHHDSNTSKYEALVVGSFISDTVKYSEESSIKTNSESSFPKTTEPTFTSNDVEVLPNLVEKNNVGDFTNFVYQSKRPSVSDSRINIDSVVMSETTLHGQNAEMKLVDYKPQSESTLQKKEISATESITEPTVTVDATSASTNLHTVTLTDVQQVTKTLKETLMTVQTHSEINEICSDNKDMFSFGSIEVKELGLPPKYKSIVQWKNKNNSCWLDTLLTIIVFSVNIRAAINRNMQELALFNRLSTLYDQCQKRHSDTSTADTNVVVEHDIYNQLDFARSYVLNQLRQKLPSLSPGDHESCFEMFSNILKLGPLSKLFSVTLRWEFECDECQYKKARRVTTEITSFPSTTPDFHPLNASFHRSCFTCSAQNQLMTMVMERIPPCLMLHFEQGLPHNRFKVLDFGIQGHLYSVTAAVQYINKPFNHFIVWIRDCKANKWLCCDDLNPVSSWQSRPPKIPPGEIHMVMWEKQGLNLNLWKSDSNHDQMSEHLCPVDNEEAILLGEDIPANLFKEDQPEETIIVDEADDCVSSRSHPSESKNNVQETVKPSISDLPLVTKQEQDPQQHQQTHAAEDECSSNSDEITESNMVNEVNDDLALTSDEEPMAEDLYSQVSFKIKKTRDVSINNAPDLSNQISDISKDRSIKKPKENCFTTVGDIQKSETEKKSADSPVVSDQVKMSSNHYVASDHGGTSQVQENVSMEDKVPQLNTERRKRFKRILHLPNKDRSETTPESPAANSVEDIEQLNESLHKDNTTKNKEVQKLDFMPTHIMTSTPTSKLINETSQVNQNTIKVKPVNNTKEEPHKVNKNITQTQASELEEQKVDLITQMEMAQNTEENTPVITESIDLSDDMDAEEIHIKKTSNAQKKSLQGICQDIDPVCPPSPPPTIPVPDNVSPTLDTLQDTMKSHTDTTTIEQIALPSVVSSVPSPALQKPSTVSPIKHSSVLSYTNTLTSIKNNSNSAEICISSTFQTISPTNVPESPSRPHSSVPNIVQDSQAASTTWNNRNPPSEEVPKLHCKIRPMEVKNSVDVPNLNISTPVKQTNQAAPQAPQDKSPSVWMQAVKQIKDISPFGINTSSNRDYVMQLPKNSHKSLSQKRLSNKLPMINSKVMPARIVMLPVVNPPLVESENRAQAPPISFGQPLQHSDVVQKPMEHFNSVDFLKLKKKKITPNRLSKSSSMNFESYRPKRTFKLAGYKKADLKKKQPDQKHKPYEQFKSKEKQKPTPTTSPPANQTGFGAMDKTSEISDMSDLLADIDSFSYSSGASGSSNPLSNGSQWNNSSDCQIPTPTGSFSGDSTPRLQSPVPFVNYASALKHSLDQASLDDLINDLDSPLSMKNTIPQNPLDDDNEQFDILSFLDM